MAASPVPRRSFPAENQERMTASVMYNRPSNLARERKLGQHNTLGPHAVAAGSAIFNSYLARIHGALSHAELRLDAHRECSSARMN